MLTALLLLASVADWVPMRWGSSDPATLELLNSTPINCLLLEDRHWSAPFITAATKTNIATLGVIRPRADAADLARKAAALKMSGVVLEGGFERTLIATIRDTLPVIELPARANLRFDATPIVGTYQGVWPGIQVDEGGSAKAAPSGAPWINTNSGFLRFVRAATTMPVWIGYAPPAQTVVTSERYLQAICDAGIIGARWIVTLDTDFEKRFFARDIAALKDWKRIAEQLAFFEQHRAWQSWQPLGQLAIVQDAESGALFSGGVLDMIAVKHTPVRTVPTRKLTADAMQGTKMAVNVDPSSLNDQQKESLRTFARRGGMLLSGPATWKFPAVTQKEITLKEDDVKMLDDIWKEVNTMTGRRNLGVRLFNVSSMLSNIVESGDSKAVLYLVNYSGYPVENITVHLLGKYKAARLLAPGAAAKTLGVYENEEGTGVDIDAIAVSAAIVLE